MAYATLADGRADGIDWGTELVAYLRIHRCSQHHRFERRAPNKIRIRAESCEAKARFYLRDAGEREVDFLMARGFMRCVFYCRCLRG